MPDNGKPYVEYFHRNKQRFIRRKGFGKWEMWWDGDLIEDCSSRESARKALRGMNAAVNAVDAEDRAAHKKAVDSLEKLAAAYELVGQLDVRSEGKYETPEHIARHALEALPNARKEAEKHLSVVREWLRFVSSLYLKPEVPKTPAKVRVRRTRRNVPVAVLPCATLEKAL